jgi:membrane protease YdiL (CAAX protease family)
MEPYAVFLNKAGRLRSGWRVGVFVIFLLVISLVLGYLLKLALLAFSSVPLVANPLFGDLMFRLLLVTGALLAGWLSVRFLEGLPWRSLGVTFHAWWWWDFLIGSIIGGASLLLAVLIAFATGSLRFTFSGSAILAATLKGMSAMALLFAVGALAEEALFRGYPLQTLTRARLAWLAILLTSVPFAIGHLNNPNVVAGFTFVNTAIAGVWLAAAYLRTRSLWFPLGVHWSWNWMLGSVLGIPVSGLKFTSHTLFTANDLGPAWITGSSYGIEGGLACTIALALSTLFIWRTKLVSATPELLKLTSEENPVTAKRQVISPASELDTA